jgi:hypothetical protein
VDEREVGPPRSRLPLFMLFLYRTQNDPFETTSYNAMELDSHSLIDFVRMFEHLFQCSFQQSYNLRIRKTDPTFGFIWQDVPFAAIALQLLEGDTVILRLLKLNKLELGTDRVPSQRTMQAPSITTTKQALPPVESKKRPQQVPQPPQAPPPSAFKQQEEEQESAEVRAEARVKEREGKEKVSTNAHLCIIETLRLTL